MRAMLSRLLFLGLCISTFNGCATLVSGRYDKVDIITEPSGVEIYDSQGFNIGITPVQTPLKRLPRQQLTFRKEGYVDTTVVMSTSINPWSTPFFLSPVWQFMQYEGCDGCGWPLFKKFVLAEAILSPVSDILLGGIFKKGEDPYVIQLNDHRLESMESGAD